MRRTRWTRLFWDRLGWILALAAMALSLIPLLDILVLVGSRGIEAMSWSIFTQVTSGVSGGLANAIWGTLLIVLVAMLIAAPLGIFGGVYLTEFSPRRLADALRRGSDILTGVPSIVLGYVGYVTMVVWWGWGFSLLAAGITLTVLMLPYILRATELALGKVPSDLRQASLALGAGRAATIWRITLRSAAPGILTGIILALSIAMGETAPLLYTAGWSNYLPTAHLTHAPVGYLTYVVWTYINEPFASAHALAYAAAFLLIFMILAFNVLARWGLERLDPHARGARR